MSGFDWQYPDPDAYDPDNPLGLLEKAAAAGEDDRTTHAIWAVRSMIAAKADAGVMELARQFAGKSKVLRVTSFDRLEREARAGDPEQQAGQERPSASTELVRIACDRYDFGLDDGAHPFAIPKDGPSIALMLRGGKTSLRGQLARDYYARTGRAAAQQALADALLVIEGMAQERRETPLYLRAARHEGIVWLDLGDPSGRAVRITRQGWSVQDSAPVLFKRTALTGALPEPEPHGSLSLLWDLLNVAADDRPLVAAWLIAALIHDIPHPVLGLFGEQGTGKTTAARMLASLLDPGPVPVRKPPRDGDSWVTAAAGSWIVAVDNLSDIQPWLSDSLCRAVTGDGDVRRKLYTDGELAVFAYRRCVILNGIDTGAMQADLADRMLPIDLELIAEATRLSEEDIWPAWQASHPQLLGALLSLASRVLAALPGVQLERKPRMADFGRILAAVDSVLNTAALARYMRRGADLAADGLSGESFAVAIQDQLAGGFDGTSAQLHKLLTGRHLAELDAKLPKDWPKDGRAVTTLLHKIAPALRKLGWTFAESRDSHTKLLRWKFSPPGDLERQRDDHRSSPQRPQMTNDSGDAVIGGNTGGPSQHDGHEERPACDHHRRWGYRKHCDDCEALQ